MATLLEVENLLKENGIIFDEKSQYFLNELTKYNYESLRQYIENCVFVHNEIYSVAPAITIENVYSIISKANLKMLKNIQNEFYKISKATGLDHDSATKALKSICDSILDISDRTDQEIAIISAEYVTNLIKINQISASLNRYLDKDIATQIYSNCINRMQSFIQKSDPNEIKSVVYYCLNNLEQNKLSADDMLQISKKCASFYADTTYEKISKTTKKLQLFQWFILENVRSNTNDANKEAQQLLTQKLRAKDLHNILLSSPSVFTTTPSTIAFNIEFIKGYKTLGEIIKEFKIPVSKADFEQFKDIRVSTDIGDLADLYLNNLSALTTSPNALLTSIKLMDNTRKKIFGQDIVPEEYITSQNFTQLSRLFKFATSNKIKNLTQWADNLTFLGKILDKNQLKQYFLSNLDLATIPTEHLKKQIENTIIESDPSLLSNNIGILLDTNFNWDSDKACEKPSKPKFDKMSSSMQVELSQENVANLLTELGYAPETLQTLSKHQPKKSGIKLVATEVSQYNDLVNSITKYNNMLDNNPITMTLFAMKESMGKLFRGIDNLQKNNFDQTLCSNLQASLDNLIIKYNKTIDAKKTSTQQEYDKLTEEYKELEEQVDNQYQRYVEYHNQTPEIITKREELIRKKTIVVSAIKKLQDQQEENRKNKLAPATSATPYVTQYFDEICALVQAETKQRIIQSNPAKSTSQDDKQKYNDNLDFLYDKMRYKTFDSLPGDIFNSLKQLKNSQFSDIYQTICENLRKQGIDVDIQIWYSQPENFHGEAISDERIKHWLGDQYSSENFHLVKKYNYILSSGTKTFNAIQEKLAVEEDILHCLNEELQKLDNQIMNGSSDKRAVNLGKRKLNEIWNKQEKIGKNIQELDELTFE